MITISAEWLRAHWDQLTADGAVSVPLSNWDGADAFTLAELGPLASGVAVRGGVVLGAHPSPNASVVVRLTPAEGVSPKQRSDHFLAPDGRVYGAVGQYHGRTPPADHAVEIVEVASAIAERRAAILETTLLSGSSVFILGLGTGGITATVELAKTGVGQFYLMDPDRLGVGNVARHHAGVSHAGRKKVNVAHDLVLEKNPAAIVDVYAEAAAPDTESLVRDLVRKGNVVVCAVDGRPSKLYVNRLCVEEGRTAIYGGAFRRAFGGQVFRVRPHRSPCYQCFVMAMSETEADFEVASPRDAEVIAYSDRPVQIEPGLALDLAPIATMVARLALHELVLDKSTSLKALERDFALPWYVWLNRPESGTPYASWPPLSESSDEMTILRWYGIDLPMDPGCPVCGDFVSATQEAYALDRSQLPELPTRDLDLPR